MERILHDGVVHVHYSQIYVVSESDLQPMPDEACAGQTNGLCGAAQPGSLFMTTGLHTGSVGFRVEAHDTEPPVDLFDHPVIDSYLLQFWPAPSAPDRVIKQTSDIAAYWHGVARKLPAPDSPEMRAVVERRQQMMEDKPQRIQVDPDVEQPSGPRRQIVSIRYEKGT